LFRKFFKKQVGPTKWNDSYVLRKESFFWICWGLHKLVILAGAIPFLILAGIDYFWGLPNVQIPSWFTLFVIGLFGSWVITCIKVTEKILVRYRIIIPSNSGGVD